MSKAEKVGGLGQSREKSRAPDVVSAFYSSASDADTREGSIEMARFCISSDGMFTLCSNIRRARNSATASAMGKKIEGWAGAPGG